MVVGIWAAAAVLGVVEAPPIVVAAGIVAFVIVALGAVGAAAAFRRWSRPLDQLIEASGRIEAGDYSVRVPESGSGDMRSLAHAFNQMSERLEVSDARRRAFLADVAHELRTPLTVLQGQLEAIGDGVYEADDAHIASLLAHARSMSRLVEDLRTISLAEVGGLDLQLRPTDLRAIVEEVMAGYAPSAQLAGVTIESELPGSALMAEVDEAAVRRVLLNLTGNALRHTPAGGRVTLRARLEDTDAGRDGSVVEVVDTGSGIPPELAPRAFDRFVKGPGSDGSGLGLAIARDLVEAQAGTIELLSEHGAGTTVRLRFPAVAAGSGPRSR